MRKFRFACCIALGLAIVGSVVVAQSNPPEPLREVDIVRMVLSDVPTESILARIAERQVDFDVSPEMLEELRLAGVPESVVQAMRERQRVLDAGSAEQELPPQVEHHLRVRLNPGSGTRHLDLKSDFDLEQARQLQLDKSVELEFGDLAVFLACLTAEHVPDHWRSKSPLGRDFVSIRRHRLLAFVSGAEVREAAIGTGRTLRLDLPESLEFTFDGAGRHYLVLGIAAQADGRYFRLAADSKEGVTIGIEGLELDGTLRGQRAGRSRGLAVTLRERASVASEKSGEDL